MGERRTDDETNRATSSGTAVPAPLTSLIGRVHELEGISGTLRKCRLLTVTGPGGVGKTRLATEVARRQLNSRLDAVCLVDLAAGPRTPEVASETARVLGLRTSGGTAAIEALCEYLGEREVLVVLDNCEHVIDECAAVAGAVLGSCSRVRILATSREPLGIAGETVWRVAPLAPEDARRLFVERARHRVPEFLPDEETELTIASLCERLDRLPLAIELAAARMSAMSAAEILAGLEARLGELAGVRRLSPAHHRSLRAAIEWSHQHLNTTEQQAFRALAVFVGSFDGPAARSVAPRFSLDVLTRLVDKSVVTTVAGPHGRTRYRLLETVREYAYELLVSAAEVEPARQRHFHHYLELCDGEREGWPSTRADVFVEELEPDYGNVRAALEWAALADPCSAVRLLAGVSDLFFVFGQADGRRLAELVLERCAVRDRNRANAQISAGVFAFLSGDSGTARRTLAEARQLSASLGERGLEGWARFFEGLVEVLGGTVEGAREHLEAGRRLHRQVGVRVGEARSTAALGLTYLMQNETERAQKLVEEALSIQIAEDDRFGQGQCHTYLGLIAAADRNAAGASSHFSRAVECLRPYRDAILLPAALVGQASVLLEDDPATALRVAAAASAVRARVGGQFAPFYRAVADRVRSGAESALGPDARGSWTEGLRLSIDEAIALAFDIRRLVPPSFGPLSGREVEIGRLVAQGLSNKEIARRLQLSVRTVESHVRNALGKVGVPNRTQLATWMRDRTQ